MTKAVTEIADRLKDLSDEERLDVLLALLEQLNFQDAAEDLEPGSEVREELDRRLSHMDSHPDDGIPLSEAIQKARMHLRNKAE